MKIKHSRALLSFLLVVLFILLAAGNFTPTVSAAQNAERPRQEISAAPLLRDGSEIGSTDGILIMGVVIVLIVTLPLILRKKK